TDSWLATGKLMADSGGGCPETSQRRERCQLGQTLAAAGQRPVPRPRARSPTGWIPSGGRGPGYGQVQPVAARCGDPGTPGAAVTRSGRELAYDAPRTGGPAGPDPYDRR